MSNVDDSDNRRRFLRRVTQGVAAVGVVGIAVPFVSSMTPSARAKAQGAPVQIDISKLQPGQMITVEWRRKPIYVVNRTEEMLASLDELGDKLADPSSERSLQPDYAENRDRSIKPAIAVLEGVCTHLGCAPVERFVQGAESGVADDWLGGFYCPCHGSKFDLAGRVYAGVPAPTNLPVPPHSFIDDTTLLIGVDPEEGGTA